jgi:TP901 family phage tail tape measure protein
MADERFQVVIGAVDEASRILQQVKGELEGLGVSTQSAQRTMSQAFGDMQRAGAAMSATITAPIVGVGAAAIKTSIDFESAFAGVVKTVDATEGELAQLEQGILEMSKELPASASEIAQVAEAAGQLGIRTEDILSFTRTMIDLGETTNLSADQAATALARFANIVQMPQDQFDKLGSTVVELGNKLATTEAEIVEMGLRIAGAGEQVGMTEAQIMALAGALSSVGIEAEAGG